MTYKSSTYQSKLYQEFKGFDKAEYRAVVRFYEDYTQDIKSLPFEEYFEILIRYIDALFETGAYEKHLTLVDKAIEISIINNIKIHKGFNIFQRLLFRKALSFYNLMEYDKAERILRELIRICPSESLYSNVLIRCLRKQTPKYVLNMRAISILLFLITAAIITVELIIVRSSYPENAVYFEWTRNSIFLVGLLCLVVGDSLWYFKIHRSTKAFVKKVQAEKVRKHKKRRQRQFVL